MDELSSLNSVIQHRYFIPQIVFPSRINRSTETLIDNIFCNISQPSEQNISANLKGTYSNHLPQTLLVHEFYWYKNVRKSDQKTFNNATFSADYKSTDWPNIIQIDRGNPNLSFQNYIDEVEEMISNHAPLRKTRMRELKFHRKLRITSGLQKSTVIKNKLFGKFINAQTQ